MGHRDGYILGLDAGTTSLKAALFTGDGRLAAADGEDYVLQTPRTDWVEYPAERYWEHLCALTGRLLSQSGIQGEQILSLAISSQGETLICLDEKGEPLMPAIVWLDNRSQEEAGEIEKHFGRQAVYEHTGQPECVATWPATKIAWLKRHRPEIYRKTGKFLLLEDYLLYRLTGRTVCEENLLASSLLYDINRRCWWKEMLDYLGLDPSRLPEVLPCASPVGRVTAEAAAQTGLSPSILVGTGALDQTCGIIGAGRIRPGEVTETTGSCLAVSANVSHFLPYREGQRITCQNHAVPGRYVVLLWSQTAGMVLKWFTNTFYAREKEAGADVFALADEEASRVPPGSGGLVMLPHLSGASNPEYNASARGVFYGITLQHGRGHFARAILEAVAYMLRRNLAQVEEMGQQVERVYSMGGGSKSPVWNAIKADVTGKRLETLKSQEGACLGAAMLGAVSAGLYPDIDTAADRLARPGEVYLPNPENRAVYERGYAAYLDLYTALEPLFARYKA